jgi:hypothetical protein
LAALSQQIRTRFKRGAGKNCAAAKALAATGIFERAMQNLKYSTELPDFAAF